MDWDVIRIGAGLACTGVEFLRALLKFRRGDDDLQDLLAHGVISGFAAYLVLAAPPVAGWSIVGLFAAYELSPRSLRARLGAALLGDKRKSLPSGEEN